MRQTLSFVHRFEPGQATVPPLLLLHGTGGNEADLLPLGREIAPDAALLSPRGQVSERGMPRFFRRLAEGVFDEDDLRRRVDDLVRFVAEAREAYNLAAPLAVGFSNGANIAAAMLLTRPEVLAAAVLLRAMPPFQRPPPTRLEGKPILMLSGNADPLVPEVSARRLAETFEEAGADLEHHVLPAEHGLGATDFKITSRWLDCHRAAFISMSRKVLPV